MVASTGHRPGITFVNDEITSRSASGLAADVGQRKLGASEVVTAFLERIERLNGALNAVCTRNEHALAEAETCDKRLRAGKQPRLLEGVPFLAKDNLQTRGIRTTFGSMIYERYVPDEDAVAVERLRAAGAILLGKTNTPEFAHDVNTTNRLFGTTRNPWNLRVTAGGSSGGTGAAVAAGLAPIGLGTDLGGSIRIPSAFCGTVGLRPVPGRVPVYPAEVGWDTPVQMTAIRPPCPPSVTTMSRWRTTRAGSMAAVSRTREILMDSCRSTPKWPASLRRRRVASSSWGRSSKKPASTSPMCVRSSRAREGSGWWAVTPIAWTRIAIG